MKEFLNSFFELEKKVIKYHMSLHLKYKLKSPKVDFCYLKRFLDDELNFLASIDEEIYTTLLKKLFIDSSSIYELNTNFTKTEKMPLFVFEEEYLQKYHKEYRDSNRKLEKNINLFKEYNERINVLEEELKNLDQKEEKYKKLKKEYVDLIHYSSELREKIKKIKERLEEIYEKEKPLFLEEFKYFTQKLETKLKQILNTKLFYLDKLIWFNAYKSDKIKEFFRNSDIRGDFSLKTFIEYRLKNIDELKYFNSKEITKLKEILKAL